MEAEVELVELATLSRRHPRTGLIVLLILIGQHGGEARVEAKGDTGPGEAIAEAGRVFGLFGGNKNVSGLLEET